MQVPTVSDSHEIVGFSHIYWSALHSLEREADGAFLLSLSQTVNVHGSSFGSSIDRILPKVS